MEVEIELDPARETILVIDDDDTLRPMICRALSERFDVAQASDAFKAMAYLEAAHDLPDVIVCDVMMPGQNGFDFVRKIRESARYKKIPIVFLTARSAALDVVEGINVGARSYVTKPFKMNALVERIGKILESRR